MLYSSRQYVVIIGAEDNSGNKYINNLGSVLSGVFILSLLISALTGWFFASQALTPFNNLLEEVDQITARNLDKRLKAVKNKDEIAHITNSFNGLLDRLENAFKLQKNFVSHASHEFRTPLTALKLQIEVALLQKRPLEEYIVLLKSLNEDINNLIDMQEGLNQLTKANAEIPVEKFEPIQMLEILMDAQSELVKGKPHFRIHVSIENFSDNEIRNSISGDYTLIKSALMNLMDNACKFSPDHSAEVTIIYLLTEIRIAIKDNGPGISDKDIDHIFEPFFRSEETRKITGHGIGLSLVKRITELHKGSISVKTAKDAGTTFTLRFPNRITNEAIVV
jgi:signal transduction histidine kinase